MEYYYQTLFEIGEIFRVDGPRLNFLISEKFQKFSESFIKSIDKAFQRKFFLDFYEKIEDFIDKILSYYLIFWHKKKKIVNISQPKGVAVKHLNLANYVINSPIKEISGLVKNFFEIYNFFLIKGNFQSNQKKMDFSTYKNTFLKKQRLFFFFIEI